MDRDVLPVPSVVSSRLARRPCFELLCTNMLSEMARSGPSTATCVEITTCVRIILNLSSLMDKLRFLQLILI